MFINGSPLIAAEATSFLLKEKKQKFKTKKSYLRTTPGHRPRFFVGPPLFNMMGNRSGNELEEWNDTFFKCGIGRLRLAQPLKSTAFK